MQLAHAASGSTSGSEHKERPDDIRHPRPGAEALSAPDPTAGYAPGEQRPLAAYAVLTGAFFAALAGAGAAAAARGRDIDRPSALDVALDGLAIQKANRLIAKDKVTSFLRAPFTRGFAVGHVFAPRTTRLLSAMWASQAIADGVQLAYSGGKEQT